MHEIVINIFEKPWLMICRINMSGAHILKIFSSIDRSYKVPNISAQSMIKYIQYNYIIAIKYIDILQIESGNFHQIHTYIHKYTHIPKPVVYLLKEWK